MIGKKDIFDFRIWLLNGGFINDREAYIIDGKVCVDYFIQYESRADDMEIINAKLEIDSYKRTLPKFKTGIRSDKFKIRDFYDTKTENLVKEIYRWEIERFGYEMP